MSTSNDDMLALSCSHDKNDCVSSSLCVANNVKETQLSMEQYVDLSGASSNDSSSSTTFCLMAKDSKVSTLNLNISHDDNSDDDGDKEVDYESKKLGLWSASLEGETK